MVSQNANKRSESRLVWARLGIISVLIGVSLFGSLRNISQYFVDVDEPGWIVCSYYYTDMLMAHDWNINKWLGSDLGREAYNGAIDPHVGEWMLGFPLVAYRAATGHSYEHQAHDREMSRTEFPKPPPEVLGVARSVAAIFGIGCFVLLFLIGDRIGGIFVGATAAGMGMANVYVHFLFMRAYMDSIMLFFFLCWLLTMLHLQSAASRKTQAGLCVLAATFAALSTSVKISILPLCLVAVAVMIAIRSNLPVRWRVSLVALFAVWSVGGVHVLDPYLWPDSIVGRAEPSVAAALTPYGFAGYDKPSYARLPWLFVSRQRVMRSQTVRFGWKSNVFWHLHKGLLRELISPFVPPRRLVIFEMPLYFTLLGAIIVRLRGKSVEAPADSKVGGLATLSIVAVVYYFIIPFSTLWPHTWPRAPSQKRSRTARWSLFLPMVPHQTARKRWMNCTSTIR